MRGVEEQLLRGWEILEVLVREDSLCRVSWSLLTCFLAQGGLFLRGERHTPGSERPLFFNNPDNTVINTGLMRAVPGSTGVQGGICTGRYTYHGVPGRHI